MRRQTSLHPADRVPSDAAGAVCRWGQGNPWFGILRDVRVASAAAVELIVPHEAGAMAVQLWRPPGRPAWEHRDVRGDELRAFANLATLGVSARLHAPAMIALFKVAPSTAVRFDNSAMQWEGGPVVTLSYGADLTDAIMRAVLTTTWPPAPPPALVYGRPAAPLRRLAAGEAR